MCLTRYLTILSSTRMFSEFTEKRKRQTSSMHQAIYTFNRIMHKPGKSKKIGSNVAPYRYLK